MSKPIYLNNVTIVELQKKGIKMVEKSPISFEFPTTSTNVNEILESDTDLIYLSSRLYNKMKSEEKVRLFKENYRVKRVDMGRVLGETSIVLLPNAEDFQ